MSSERQRRGALAQGIAILGGMALATGALAACANILGIEDRTFAGSDDGSFSSNTASTGSSSGTSGSGSSTGASSSGVDGGIEDAARDVIERGTGDGTIDEGGDVAVPEASTACGATGNCVIASGLDYPWIIASDETRVYWTESGTNSSSNDGAVKSCPVTGCGANGLVVYASGINFPRVLVIDSSSIYWGTNDSFSNGGIWKCPLAGCNGAPTRLASASQPYGMALDNTYVYWVDQLDSSVHRMAKTAGQDQVLDDGGRAHGEPVFAAVDTSFVYFTDDSAGLFALPFDGGAARTVATNDIGFVEYPVAVDSTSLYYGAESFDLATNGATDDFFFRADKKTVMPQQVPLVTNLTWAFSLALDSDAGHLYFGDFGDGLSDNGQVGRVNTDGTGVHYFGQNTSPIEWVSFNSTYLFWCTYAEFDSQGNLAPNAGTIVRSAK